MRPVYPTIQSAHVFQKFGNINHKLYGATNGKHMGIDIGVTGGQPGAAIFSVMDGQVIECGYYDAGGYGRRVVISHDGGNFKTLYAHLKDLHVQLGDIVSTGQQIGTMGGNLEDKYRGASSGTHLHFEVILPVPREGSIKTSKGWTVDPFPYLMENYFPAPTHVGIVVSTRGMYVRSKPEVNAQSLKIGTLSYRERVFIMDMLPDDGNGNQWARLMSLRDEWVSVVYGGARNIEVEGYVVQNVKSPDTTTSYEDPTKSTLTNEVWNSAIEAAIEKLEGLKR